MGRKSKRAENLKRRSDFGSVNSEKENDIDNYSDVSETPTDTTIRKPFVGGVILQLDSWPDELSPAQLAAYKKADDEHQEIQGKLDAIVKSSGGEVVFSGDSCAAYQVSGNTPAALSSHIKSAAPSVPTKTSSFSSETSTTRQGTPRRERQSKQLANSKLSAIVQDEDLPLVKESSKKSSSSKAPSRTTGRSSRSSQSALAAPSPPPTPVKPAGSSKSSKSSTRSSKNSAKAASPEPASTKKQPAALQNAAGGVRPTEATSVGGLATGMPGQPKPKGSSTVVDLTKDDSGRPVPDSREVSFNKLQGKTFPSLVVVARPYLRAKDNGASDRAILDAKVKSVLMHTATKFTEWLIQQGLVRSEQICAIHTNNRLKLGMYSDVSKFPFSGGYVWISECCPTRFVSVFSGSLFEGATHPPSVILKLIYHWSCQTNVQNVVQWVKKVDNLYVKGLFTWLRAVCTAALHQHMSLLGGSGRRIEVGVISLGTTSQDGHQRQVKVEVLGVLDPEAKLVRLRAVEPLVDGERNYKKRFSKILEPLSQWVHKDSIILTDLTVDKGTLLSMGFKTVHQVSTTEHNSKNSNTGIMEYLRRIVPRMFQNTLSLLSRQIIQQFLDELVWREWYGNTPGTAFDNIVAHIAEQTRLDSKETLVNRLVKVAANPFKNWAPPPPPPVKESPPPPKRSRKRAAPEPPASPAPTKKEKREKKAPPPLPTPTPSKRAKKQVQLDDPDIEIVEDKDMTPIETFYYGIIDGDLKLTQAQPVKMNVNCCVCSETFTSNTKLLDHLLAHVNPVTDKESVQCRYCAELIPTEDEHRRHIIQAHPNDTKNTMVNTMACVMCETRYSNLSSLSTHMQKNHVNAELPYICGTCGHRCSSQRIAIEHFYDTHEGTATLQCPHCLQMTAVWSQDKSLDQNIQMFYDHLKTHMNKQFTKKCNKCALWFVHKGALKDHQLYCHLTQANLKRKIKNMCISSTMINRPKLKTTSSKESNMHTVTENFEGVTMYIPDGMNCVECTNDFGDPRHFPGVLKCVKCSFSTNCSRSMYKHGSTCSGTVSTAQSINPLIEEMHCICGFSADEGNKLAKHLAICDRKSAYSSAMNAASNTVARSMLDMLGLVRRADPDGESSVDDNVEKAESDATQDTETPVEADALMETDDALVETTAEKMEQSDVAEDLPEPMADNIPVVDPYSSTGDIEGVETSNTDPVIDTGLSLDDLAPPSVLAPQDLDIPQDLGKDEYQSLATPQVSALESTLESGFEPLPAEPMPQPEFEPL